MGKRKTHEKFLQEVYEKVGNEYTVLGKYINARTRIKIKHNVCGYEFEIKADSILSYGGGCKNCADNAKRKTIDKFKQELYEIFGDEYTVTGSYKNYYTPIKIRHNACKSEYMVQPKNILGGTGCKKCYFESKKTKHEDFIDIVYNLVGDDYTVTGEYIHSQEYIEMLHNDCGNKFKVKPNLFIYNNLRCTECTNSISKGELAIMKWLDINDIEYKMQYRFDDCRNKNPLPFDFAIFHNGKLLSLIEYDGEQHYIAQEYFGGEEKFKIQQRNDEIKNEYCKKNDIELIRIPYWDIDELDYRLNTELQHLFIRLGEGV